MSSLTICLIIFILSLISYLLNKLPIAITSLAAMMALVLTGCIDAPTALSGFGNTNTVVMCSMFVIAAGLNRTQFIDKISAGIIKLAGGSYKRAYLGYLLLAMIITNFLQSPMTTFAIVFPLCSRLCIDSGISPTKAMFPLGVVSISCIGILPFGTAISSAVRYNGYLESFGMGQYKFVATDIFWGRWPTLVVVILWAYFLAPKFAPDSPPVPISGSEGKKSEAKTPLKPFSETMGYLIFFGAIILLILGSALNIPAWQVCVVGAILVVVCGVLTEREAIASMPISVAFMYVGALAMGNALNVTGAGTVVGEWLAKVVGGTQNGYVIGALFFIVPFLLTQVMLNQAVINIFTPICILTCQALGANPMGAMLLVAAGSGTAFMTHLATPAIPLVMAAGGYNIKSLLKQSWLIAIILTICCVFYTMTVFPAF